MRGGPSDIYPISSDHHSFAAKIITNLKNARSQERGVYLTSICNYRSGGTVSALQMGKLRLGEVRKSQSQQVQGCRGAPEPLLSDPTSSSAQLRAGSSPCLPTAPTVTGLLHLGPGGKKRHRGSYSRP